MKIIVINLKDATKRKEAIIKEFERIGIDNYEFFEAFDGRKQDLSKYHDAKAFKQIHNREMNPGELGCTLSHLSVLNEVIKTNEPALILEDDAFFLENGAVLKDLDTIDFDFDVIFLNPPHYALKEVEYKGAKTNLSICNVPLEQIDLNKKPYLWWLGSSYIISPAGAKKAINNNYPIKYIIDTWFMYGINKAYKPSEYLMKQRDGWEDSSLR